MDLSLRQDHSMEINVACDCGKVKGAVDPKYLKGYRAICLCNDCQAYAHSLGRPDLLDANGGTDIIPCTPAQYKITAGKDLLRCTRLSDQGMFRWSSSCCKTPMGNAMSSPDMPYIGIPQHIFLKNQSTGKIDEIFGPVRERMQAQYAIGDTLPPLSRKTVSLPFLLRAIKLILSAKLRKAGSPSPFFTDDGKPLSEPQVLSPQELAALHARSGQKRKM